MHIYISAGMFGHVQIYLVVRLVQRPLFSRHICIFIHIHNTRLRDCFSVCLFLHFKKVLLLYQSPNSAANPAICISPPSSVNMLMFMSVFGHFIFTLFRYKNKNKKSTSVKLAQFCLLESMF
jgi:hypothetical protein